MTKVLVTGGTGFIGSHIVDELIKKNYEVVIIDNLSTGKEKNINQKAKLIKIDITEDLNNVFKAENPKIVIHAAAHVMLRDSFENPVFDAKTNIIGTIRILEASRKNNVKKI